MENIGSNYSDEEYEIIKNELNRSDSVTVWVKKPEVGDWEPQVFQIETEKGIVLGFQTVRFKDRPLIVFLLLMGLGCVILPIYALYPMLFRRRHLEK